MINCFLIYYQLIKNFMNIFFFYHVATIPLLILLYSENPTGRENLLNTLERCLRVRMVYLH